jgi:hypothetical protein
MPISASSGLVQCKSVFDFEFENARNQLRLHRHCESGKPDDFWTPQGQVPRVIHYSIWLLCEPPGPPRGPRGICSSHWAIPWTPRGTHRALLDPLKDPRGVCSSHGDDFYLGDLFYYYQKDLSRLNR